MDFVLFHRHMAAIACGVGVLLMLKGAACADVATLNAAKDNTVIEILFQPVSNGIGDSMFSGRTGNPHIVRAVMAFDLTSIPRGSTVTAVTLKLTLTQSSSQGAPLQTHNLHRLLANWGEGQSLGFGGGGAPAEPGDVTWLHTFYPDQFWINQGGDFEATPSASLVVGSIPVGGTPVPYEWSSAQMVADVQAWVNDASANFGWMLRGNEVDALTVRRFATRENVEPTYRPVLTVEFDPPGQCAGDVNSDQVVNVQDLLAVINAWGACPQPCPPACAADINGNCIVNVQDLLAVINAWGACQ